MAATEDVLKNLITGCELITISKQNVLENLKTPEINQYIITGDDIFFWSPQLDKPKKIDLLPKKSWETFKQTLNLDKNRKATRADLDTINFFTGHTLSDHIYAKLLTVVLGGEQDKAEWSLKRYPELLLRKTDFTDPWTKESFKDKSVFQYAKWAKDTRMYTMMLDCLPQNEQGEEIRKGLLEQAKAQTEHFDFMPLIMALQNYLVNFLARDWPQREAHWCTVVGLAQQNLPAHVRQEYCTPDRSFCPVPNFTDRLLTRSLRFYNWASNTWHNWDLGLLGLGSDFAISRGAFWAGGGSRPWRTATRRGDLTAVTTLCEVRTADLGSLMQRLQTPIQKTDDVQGVVSQMIP